MYHHHHDQEDHDFSQHAKETVSRPTSAFVRNDFVWGGVGWVGCGGGGGVGGLGWGVMTNYVVQLALNCC